MGESPLRAAVLGVLGECDRAMTAAELLTRLRGDFPLLSREAVYGELRRLETAKQVRAVRFRGRRLIYWALPHSSVRGDF
ncbi:hypothetical protein C0J29_32120 (plasmid) [Mycobacterium paragordonae]|uniref:Fur family transcriptional regulator n=1 Tax=Mycobacterium paragordonae TaxID=1389713 RepID=A0ABQ1CFB1_9MYCO|nr:hypothetical protein [Mycobacterium paragordonae]AYE99605.1 hypothetical protein C0J29_32120 [Mycobacterium paragordonae]GFG83166.1 hypothetical protein MPRG_64420 [Mycobacterium paragordonae]